MFIVILWFRRAKIGIIFNQQRGEEKLWEFFYICPVFTKSINTITIMHIAVAGNIGSGKTTLTKLLAKHFNWEASYENVEENPYLTSFYDDMQRWAFNLQIFFLNSRFRKIREIKNRAETIIQDRTIDEDVFIFAPNLQDMGLLSTRDYETYKSLFSLINSFLTPPDLLIYLKASTSTLVEQIQKRGRDYEASIRIDYLQSLNTRYEKWINEYQRNNKGKVLIVDVDTCKFSENPEDLGEVIDRVNAELHGLF